MNIISKCKESVVDGSSPDFISTHPADWLTGPTDRWWKGHFGVSGSPEWSWRWNLQCAHCCRSSLLRRTHPPEGVWWHRGTRLTGRNTWNGDMRTSQITKGSGNNTDFRLRFDRYMDRHTVKMYSQTEAGRYTDIIEDQGTLISVWLLFSGCYFIFFIFCCFHSNFCSYWDTNGAILIHRVWLILRPCTVCTAERSRWQKCNVAASPTA